MNYLLLYKSKQPHVAAFWIHRGAEFTFSIVVLCGKACALFTWVIDFKSSYVQSAVRTGLVMLQSSLVFILCRWLTLVNMLTPIGLQLFTFCIYFIRIHVLLCLSSMPDQPHFHFFFSMNFSISDMRFWKCKIWLMISLSFYFKYYNQLQHWMSELILRNV